MKDGKFVIKEAEKTDAGAYLAYLHRIAEESDFMTFSAGEITETVEQEEAFIENSLEKTNSLFLLAKENGKIVGGLRFTGGVRNRTAHTGEFGVSVLKEYWGNGIGEQLIGYMIDWCKGSGAIRKINLRVRMDNARGIQLYKKMGFVEEGLITREFLINGTFFDSFLMGLQID